MTEAKRIEQLCREHAGGVNGTLRTVTRSRA